MTATGAEEVLGPYRLLGELGHGGMGVLFEAEHVHLGRRVALKLLAPGLAGDPAFRERFVRESQLLAAMEHPSIIPIYDAGEIDGLLYIAMRLVEGVDLGTLIAREGALEPRRALSILEQAGSALDAAHARNLVHRDVKPGNILLDEPGDRVFLTDFGIARSGRSEGRTEAGLLVGSVDYAAPEQLQGAPVGPAADIYAFGGVLFEMLTGERAFERETDLAVIYAHALEPPPAPSERRPGLPASLDRVVAVAMAKDPDARYASCRALVADARAALSATGQALIAAPVATGARDRAAISSRVALPVPATALIGRDSELAELRELLASPDVRLLTLTGPSGSGKTRLAVEAAAASGAAFPGGVAFLDLAAVSDPAAFVPTLSHALGVDEQADAARSGTALLEAVCTRLAGPRTLLVLDSFEHLLGAASVVGDLLDSVPSLAVLVTSHAPLLLRREREFPVPPLTTESGADLFVARARAVAPDFALDEEGAATVSAISARLDGLPLAIELAASRVRLFTPSDILAHLENALEFLAGGARDQPARHQTLRAAIDWSYELLEAAEQVLFARLGVFNGGFTLAAAEAVCGAGTRPGETTAGLESLLQKSLLRRESLAGTESRLTLLQSIQEYALYRLLERGELGELRRLHAGYYLGLAEEAGPELFRADQALWTLRLERETGNLRAALAWALESESLETGIRAAAALSRFWSVRGQVSEGRTWLEQALRREASVTPQTRSLALFAAGYAALGQGDFPDAIERFEQSLELARAAGDEGGVAMSLAQLGWLHGARGDSAGAVALSEESLSLARKLRDSRTASAALATLADAATARGAHSRAAELLEECLALRREAGDRRNVANALLNLGRVELVRGREERALSLLEEGLELARELGDTWGISVGLSSIGRVALARSESARARKLLREGLMLCAERRDRRLAAECLAGLAAVAAQDGEAVRAARLGGAAEHLRDTTGAVPSPLERSFEERGAEGSTQSERLRAERARGRALSFEDAVAYALRD